MKQGFYFNLGEEQTGAGSKMWWHFLLTKQRISRWPLTCTSPWRRTSRTSLVGHLQEEWPHLSAHELLSNFKLEKSTRTYYLLKDKVFFFQLWKPPPIFCQPEAETFFQLQKGHRQLSCRSWEALQLYSEAGDIFPGLTWLLQYPQ